jgi:hypothetical protein
MGKKVIPVIEPHWLVSPSQGFQHPHNFLILLAALNASKFGE